MKKDNKSASSPPEIALGKRILFSLLLFLIALGLLLLVEVALRLANYGGDLSLFISAPEEVSDYYRLNPDIGKRYFYKQFTIPTPPKDLFLKEKPENGYRIFVLGGSTTAGFPYGNNLMFSRILWRRLQDMFPDKRIEVVNTAMAAINSYTILDFTDEILEYEPDLILIYMGHNEFYGALGVASLESIGQSRSIIKIYLKMQHLRLFRLLRALISKIKTLFEKDHADKPKDLTATLMERIVLEQVIPLESELYEKGKKQFQDNLEEILETAYKANVPVVLSELVSNVGEQPPFHSVKTDSFPPANQVYKQAEEMEKSGDYDKARQLYFRAKDLDALRFRATEDFNDIIHESASKYKTTVVPMKNIFEKHSPHGIIGNNLMLEHLHPNVDGNFLMADGFFRVLMSEGYISPRWDSNHMKSTAEYKKNWGTSTLDTVYGNLNIRWLKGGWPFQPKEFHNKSLETYNPKNKVDSVALKVLIDNEIGIETGHLELANYYLDHKDYLKAYGEYRALIYTIPYETMFYEGAVQMLFKLNKEEEAVSILEESLRMRKNDFAIKNLARLYLQKGNVNKTLSYCSKAEASLTKDSEFLNILAHAYIASGVFDRFNKVLEHMHSQKINSLQPFLYHTSAKTRELAEKYNSASLTLLKKQDYNTALVLLTQSLNIKETANANKWSGQIFLIEKKYLKALSYLQKAENMGLKTADLYYNLAVTNYYLDNKKEAVRYLNKSKQIKPNHPDPSGLLKKLNLD
jgi:tetratricopeptide (TPR) repeat protein/lysophospholipase L1-like esterase